MTLQKKLVLGLALLGLVACSKKSDSTDGSSTSSFSISGTMGGLSASSFEGAMGKLSAGDYVEYYAVNALSSLSGGSGTGDGSVSAQSNQCADGSYYRVLCASWSVPPVSAYGDVNCGGANSGSFTVSGLPLSTEISCFVRKSVDGSSFKPFATLELPATSSMSGTTDTISSSGDMQLGITVGSGGTLEVSVTSGTNSTGSGTGSAASDAAALSGFYVMSCDASGNTTEQNALCKCFLDDSAYSGDKDACIAAGAASVGAVKMPININIYNLTSNGNYDFDSDGTYDLTNGQSLQGVTVWAASGTCSSSSDCTSAKSSGGEGATHFSVVTSADSSFSTAVAWASGSGKSCGSSCTFEVGSVPANNANQTTWYNWVTAMVDSAAADGAGTGKFTCTDYAGGSYTGTAVKDHAHCISEFLWKIYDGVARDSRLPRVRFDMCASGSCTDTPAASMIRVDGIEFSSGTASTNTPGAQPYAQYVFEQWQPLQSGAGGSFKQSHEESRWLQCISGSGTDSKNGIYNCPTGAGGVQCYGREEMIMKLLPTSTSGVYNMGFSTTQTFHHGVVRGGTYDGNAFVGSFSAFSVCQSVFSSSTATFVAKGTKL